MKNINQNLVNAGRVFLLFIFMGAVFVSCKKDDDGGGGAISRADFEHNYFNITGADFQGRSLPDGNSQSLEIHSISGNSTVLAGGSNLIHIEGSQNASQVVIGVKDKTGYYVMPITAGKGGNNKAILSMVDIRLLVGQGATGTFTIAISVGDGQGNFSAYQYLEVSLMQAGTGLLQVSLSWDQENDVDLHLIDPSGEEIYYGNPVSATGGQLDVDSNAGCSIDNINNENIYYEDSSDVTIPSGEYEVLVNLWSNCSVASNTNYTVVAYYGGNLIGTTSVSNPNDGVLTPNTSEMVSVMKFNISGSVPKSSGNQNQLSMPNLYKFSFDKDNKVFQNFNPKK